MQLADQIASCQRAARLLHVQSLDSDAVINDCMWQCAQSHTQAMESP